VDTFPSGIVLRQYELGELQGQRCSLEVLARRDQVAGVLRVAGSVLPLLR
jgi:hypothetical protein